MLIRYLANHTDLTHVRLVSTLPEDHRRPQQVAVRVQQLYIPDSQFDLRDHCDSGLTRRTKGD